jgi:hypothetical protein
LIRCHSSGVIIACRFPDFGRSGPRFPAAALFPNQLGNSGAARYGAATIAQNYRAIVKPPRQNGI